MRRRLAGILAALALAAAAPAPAANAAEPDGAAQAAGEPLPARNRALLLLRVLVYDRNLPRRAGDEVAIAVVYRPGHGASEADRDAVAAAIDDAAQDVVAAGRPVSARPVPFRGEADLAARLGELHASAVYACDGLEGSAGAIAAAARRAGVLSMGGSRDLVEGGLAVALVARGRRAAVVVSLGEARAEGADLDAALLSVAEVVGARAAAP